METIALQVQSLDNHTSMKKYFKNSQRADCKLQVASWNFIALRTFIARYVKVLRRQNRLRGEKSYWWHFIHRWPKDEINTITKFIQGNYQFEPLKSYCIDGENSVVWTYADRLFVKALLSIIKPLFKHIISPRCMHMKGPSGVHDALRLT